MFFAGIASADAFRRLASNQLASLPGEASLASADAFRRITSSRSEHHFPPKVASLPDEVGLASHLTNDWFFSLLS
jgi:hypothetical protein